ncbi:MAG: signal transduction histidine kinase [Halioglobus sp.]|jgi:signal transduction histidine kinase
MPISSTIKSWAVFAPHFILSTFSSKAHAVNHSLKRRLMITGVILLILVAVASTALLRTARQYDFQIERTAKAQYVYASYRALSDHTYRKMSALGQIVEEGTLVNLQERYRNKKVLRSALRDTRDSIAAELTHVGDPSEAAELEHFNKIELLAEEIIRGSELVRVAVEQKKAGTASAALEKLRSYEGSFNQLIDEALVEELREVRETQVVTRELNTILTRLLPSIFLCFGFFCALLLLSTWRSLNRNLRILEHATNAFQAGKFSHRVPNDIDEEFSELAIALNSMASKVELQRQRGASAKDNLEAIITSRTQELQASDEKLYLNSETRRQVLADISHELRTPLTIIQGEADLALRGEAKTPEEFHRALRRIKEQTVHTTRFVQDMLFVARAEDGKAPIHKSPAAIVPLIGSVCDDFSAIAAAKEVEIVRHFYEDDLVANIDTSKIKQVITILLDNAVRYSYLRSSIEVFVCGMKTVLVIEIKNSGIGLKYDESSQVFSRFYRGSDGSGKTTGAGLGLPVAKAIVDSHGGSIHLCGEINGGTTATVTLPLDVTFGGVAR